MCTTNAIESLNARFHSAVRLRGQFPNEQAGKVGRHRRCLAIFGWNSRPPISQQIDGLPVRRGTFQSGEVRILA
ncbi:transposase [Agromyces sp. ZXT2-6]|uniref:transposase n=1 Tax=Agromyces sp. ZXT2-6 TaxID=3461153 RepID=UPI004054B9A0